MMTFSQKTDYAIQALSRLIGREKEWVLAQDISNQTGIPLPYLHKILHTLGQTGLIQTKRGYRGGITLARTPQKISLLDIINAIEGDAWKHRCLLNNNPCTNVSNCPIHESWDKQRRAIQESLGTVTLDQISDYHQPKDIDTPVAPAPTPAN